MSGWDRVVCACVVMVDLVFVKGWGGTGIWIFALFLVNGAGGIEIYTLSLHDALRVGGF